jgi:hypothetical protein
VQYFTTRLLLAALLVMAAAGCTSDEQPGSNGKPKRSAEGPAKMPQKHGYFVQYAEGTVFTDGWETVLIEGSQPGVLEGVELVGAKGMSLEGVLVATSARTVGSIQVTPDFPPRHPGLGELMPAENATLDAGAVGTALQLGIEVESSPVASREAVRVKYRVGDSLYVIEFPSILVVCSPETSQERCQTYFDEIYDETEG